MLTLDEMEAALKRVQANKPKTIEEWEAKYDDFYDKSEEREMDLLWKLEKAQEELKQVTIERDNATDMWSHHEVEHAHARAGCLLAEAERDAAISDLARSKTERFILKSERDEALAFKSALLESQECLAAEIRAERAAHEKTKQKLSHMQSALEWVVDYVDRDGCDFCSDLDGPCPPHAALKTYGKKEDT